jgi:hypothetical protein
MPHKPRILMYLIAPLLACAGLWASCQAPPRRQPTQPKTFFDPAATQPNVKADPALVADYYSGDGLGYNLSLSLDNDASFKCTWTGCLGVYGTASGWWYREDDRVRFVTREATEMLVGYLKSADIVPGGQHAALVLPQMRDFYDKHGMSRLSALQRYEPRPRAVTRPAE